MYDKNPPENGGFVSNLTAVDLLNSGFIIILFKNFILIILPSVILPSPDSAEPTTTAKK